MRQKSGKELYSLIFGKADIKCIEILQSRDAIAVDDQMIYLHFKACPEEINRIFSLQQYSIERLGKRTIESHQPTFSNTDETLIPYVPKWWDIRKLGDSCIRFYYKWEGKDYSQVGYMTIDSSEVYYREDSW